MSLEGYFDSVLEIWNKYDHTECMTEDMKTVLNQFKSSKEEISGKRLKDLNESFEKIESELKQ